ncbi:competence protein CoiA family protein [Kocuria sp. HSID16901]|mgnify:CR=1 FL=1|uniref:competence protein CoiA family protein n=1 Tax=Kocuria sp. HSID16901 TaxID=2419505 RepID=UPI000F8749D5|nr:competence protein CoiA family protein [Kocuria sp. HSID16901]RUQ23498.1 hypothetical protein D8M21_02005 [Kocuria sp. HSID16901]
MPHSETASQSWGDLQLAGLEEPSSYGVARHKGQQILINLDPSGGNSPIPELAPSEATAKELAQQGAINCPVADCGPYGTTVHYSVDTDRRDHFRHPKGAECLGRTNPESNEHALAKVKLLNWATTHLGPELAASDLDTRNITFTNESGTVSVRPDAWIKLTNGTEIAIEYQHSAAEPQRVREKTAIYRKNNINVWWVFSPRHITCKVVRRYKTTGPTTTSSLRYRVSAKFTPGQAVLAKEGIMFFWFDPVSSILATPVAYNRVPFALFPESTDSDRQPTETHKKYFRGPQKGLDKYGLLRESSLQSCSIDRETGNLLSPAHHLVIRHRPKIREEITRRRQQAAEQKSREQAEAKEAAEREQARLEAEALQRQQQEHEQRMREAKQRLIAAATPNTEPKTEPVPATNPSPAPTTPAKTRSRFGQRILRLLGLSQDPKK